MSTYSWSYKTAIHRKVSAKPAKTEQEGPDENAVSQIENDSVVSHISNNDTASTVVPKRLNWRAKIYVGNLNKKTNEASLAYYFSVFGDIEDIKLIRDHDTKESRGFAFITFQKIESAEKAKRWCSFNYPTLDDNSITVASAERKTHKMKMSKNEQKAKRDPSQTLFWEFRWTNANNTQVYGPYETSLMQSWKNQGYFDRGCWVRQVLHRQVSRAEEKREVKANTFEVTGAEAKQISSTKTFEENTGDESCEAGPCKKAKLMIEYSDSDEDDEDVNENKEAYGGVAADKSLRLPENGKQHDLSLDGEHVQIQDNHDLDLPADAKPGERIRSIENEQLQMPESEERDDSSLNKESTESNADSVMEVKQGEKMSVMEMTQKEGLPNNDEKESKARLKQIDSGEFVGERMQNTNSEKDNSGTSSGDLERSNEVEQKLDILEMYEQEISSFLSEEDERQMNDEDTRATDDSSSEEEDIENEDISTEFVAVAEIDFNLYP